MQARDIGPNAVRNMQAYYTIIGDKTITGNREVFIVFVVYCFCISYIWLPCDLTHYSNIIIYIATIYIFKKIRTEGLNGHFS